MCLSLTFTSAFLDASGGRRSQFILKLALCPKAEEGREYVSTHGFSETLCLHLWRRAYRWRRHAGCGYAACTGLQGSEEKGEGAQDRAPDTRSQGQACPQGCAHDNNFDVHAKRGNGGKPRDAAHSGTVYAASTL
jgi:hypothetical protein